MKYEPTVDDRAAGAFVGGRSDPLSSDFHEKSGAPRQGPAKRAMDLMIAVPALVFIFPVLIVIAIAVKLDDGGPVLFRHRRRGHGGKPFKCLKFRTMVENAEGQLAALLASDPALAQEWKRDQKLRNDPRVTRIGRFLRKSSLDELPQLLNIILGSMSIVGPRPIVDDEVSRYGEHIAAYDLVRPGVVGLWQVSGRNDTTYEERVQLDVDYQQSWSIWLDLRIVFIAVPAVLFSRGAY